MKHKDKMQGLRGKNVAELQEQIHQNRKDIYDLRARSASMQVPNPNLFAELKKDIARCLTLITELERKDQPDTGDLPKAAGRRKMASRVRKAIKREVARQPRPAPKPARPKSTESVAEEANT